MTPSLPVVYGASYSVYVRAVLMTLLAKGVAHAVEPVDIFARDGIPDWYGSVHPFGKIPAFRHGDFVVYETQAITRYIDETFNGPDLQPATAEARACMTQIIAMTDAYGYRPLVWDIYVERVSRPKDGLATDEVRVASALPRARQYLAAMQAAKGKAEYLAGDRPSLADFHAAPTFGYFLQAPEGKALLGEFDGLAEWWSNIERSPIWAAVSR